MIKVGTLAKIRRLYFRDKLSIKEICRQTGNRMVALVLERLAQSDHGYSQASARTRGLDWMDGIVTGRRRRAGLGTSRSNPGPSPYPHGP